MASDSKGSKVTFYLVRHGETVGNIDRVLYHPDQDVLSENGKKQAALLGKHLENVQITRAFTSDYPRTFETASIVLQHQLPSNSNVLHPEDIKQDKRLRERHMGIYEGQPYQPIFTAMIASQQSIEEFCPPSCETLEEMKARVFDFFQETLNGILDSGNPSETILVVSHGYVINRFMTELKPAGDGQFVVRGWEDRCRKITTNCSYMKLEATRDEATGKLCLSFRDIHHNEHLGPDIAGRNDALLKLMATNPAARVFNDCLQA